MAKQANSQTKKKLSATTKQIDLDKRNEMIAFEAYLRAEQRGFESGDPIEDWLDAESYIDSMSE
jgi:hypothetical protein